MGDAQIAWLARQNAEQRRQVAEIQHQKVTERANQQALRPAVNGLAQTAVSSATPQDRPPPDSLRPPPDSLGPGPAASSTLPPRHQPATMQQADPALTAPGRLDTVIPDAMVNDYHDIRHHIKDDAPPPALQRQRPTGGNNSRPASARPAPSSARGRGGRRGRGGSVPPERPHPALPPTPPGPAAEDQLSAPHSLDGIDMDDIDQRVHQWLSDHPDFVVEVEKLRKGWYFFKEPINKKVYIKTIGRDKVVVRVGGGYKQLDEFFQHYHG